MILHRYSDRIAVFVSPCCRNTRSDLSSKREVLELKLFETGSQPCKLVALVGDIRHLLGGRSFFLESNILMKLAPKLTGRKGKETVIGLVYSRSFFQVQTREHKFGRTDIGSPLRAIVSYSALAFFLCELESDSL